MFNIRNRNNELSTIADVEPSFDTKQVNKTTSHRKRSSMLYRVLGTTMVALTALALIVFAPTALNVFAETTMSTDEYYKSIESSNLDKQIESITKAYGNYLDNYEKSSKGIGTEVSLKATLDSSITSSLGFEGLDSIKATILSMQTNQKSKSTISLYTNDQKFTSLNLFTDSKKDLAYLLIPELSKAYLKLPLNSEDLSGLTNSLSNKDITALLSNNPLTEELLSKILKKYTSIVVAELNNVKITGNDKVTASNVSTDCTKFTVKLNNATILSIAEKILTTAKYDNELKTLLIKFKLCTNAEYNRFVQNTLDQIDAAKVELGNSNTSEEVITMNVWTDSKGNIIGREFSYDLDSETISLGYKATRNNLDLGFEAWYTSNTEKIDIVGKAVVGLTGLTGNVKFTYGDQSTSEVLNVDFKNVLLTTQSAKSYINGKFTITSTSLPDMSIVVNLTGNTEKQSFKLDIEQAGTTFVSFLITSKEVPYKEFKLPTKPAKIYDVETQMDSYISSSNIVQYLKSINKKINVDGINAYIDQIIDVYSE